MVPTVQRSGNVSINLQNNSIYLFELFFSHMSDVRNRIIPNELRDTPIAREIQHIFYLCRLAGK